MQNVITHDGLTIDFSRVSPTLCGDGLPVWAGRVTLVFRDTVDKTVTKITANFAPFALVDFEGESEASDPIYEFCEMHAEMWAGEITDKLGKPSYARVAA
jgi:hypothetical protein